MANGSVVVVGGTQGLGRELAQSYADEGREVVVTGRDRSRAEAAAGEIGGNTRGLGFDLAEPHTIAAALDGVGEVEHLVLAAIERDVNSVRDYKIDAALRLAIMKVVGYTEVIHVLLPRLRDDSSILIYGGLARDRPYPGSTTVTTGLLVQAGRFGTLFNEAKRAPTAGPVAPSSQVQRRISGLNSGVRVTSETSS